MNMRPFNPIVCAEQDCCTNCPERIGCQMRNRFYTENDFKIELYLQIAEIETARVFPSEAAFKAATKMRNKRNRELAEHPFFSFL